MTNKNLCTYNNQALFDYMNLLNHELSELYDSLDYSDSVIAWIKYHVKIQELESQVKTLTFELENRKLINLTDVESRIEILENALYSNDYDDNLESSDKIIHRLVELEYYQEYLIIGRDTIHMEFI